MSSPRVCYIERADRGVRVRGARLAGLRTDESWSPQESQGQAMDGQSRKHTAMLAAWIRERLGTGRGSGLLDVLCLDADAAICTWAGAPSFDRPVIEAVLRQKAAPGLDADGSQASAISTVASVLGDRAEVALEPLLQADDLSARPADGGHVGASRPRPFRAPRTKMAPADGAGVRVPVIAMPDASARLLVDELDRAGVQVGAAMSIWHAMARAWDSHPASAASRAEAESVSTIAIVLVDPAGARIVWCWSRNASLLAGGSLLLPTPTVEPVEPAEGEERPKVRVAEDQAHRLVSEFLSWSVQTGTLPARIIVLTPDLDAENLGAVTTPEFGRILTEGIPTATVDLAIDNDPIGSTLRRVAERIDQTPIDLAAGAGTLASLGARPSRAHKSMYRWLAGSIAAAAAFVGVVGWRLGADAEEFRQKARDARSSSREIVAGIRPDFAESPFMREELESELEQMRKRAMPPEAMRPAKPILSELDALSLLLSMPTVSLEEINLGPANGVVTFYVPDTATAQEIEAACRDIEGLSIQWKADIRSAGESGDRRVRCSLSGQWGPTAGKQVGS